MRYKRKGILIHKSEVTGTEFYSKPSFWNMKFSGKKTKKAIRGVKNV